MTRRLLHFYVAAVILAFLALTVTIVWRAGSARATRYQEAADSFGELSRETALLWQTSPLDHAAQELNARLSNATGFQPAMLSIAARDYEFDYIWASKDRFFPAGQDQQFREGFPERINEYSHARFVRSFMLIDGDQRIITAVYPLFERSILYSILRDALIAALAILVVTALVAILHLVHRHNVSAGPRFDAEAPPESPSPRVLNPEDTLLPRLAAELERAGFADQDLSVAFITFTEGTRGDEHHRRNCEAIHSFFVFKDLCFESGDDGAVVLVPNATLTEALGLMERFQRYYWDQRREWNRESADFFSGLTARAGRLVEAQRVLDEGRAALRRSMKTTGHIVGFQPDPRKYREFLTACSPVLGK